MRLLRYHFVSAEYPGTGCSKTAGNRNHRYRTDRCQSGNQLLFQYRIRCYRMLQLYPGSDVRSWNQPGTGSGFRMCRYRYLWYCNLYAERMPADGNHLFGYRY